MCTTVPRAGCYCWVFLLRRYPGCYGTLRETNKGADQGHGVPTEWCNPTWVKVSRGQAFWELLLEFPMATLRLCGEVTYKMVGDEAICFVLARLAVHVRVVFFSQQQDSSTAPFLRLLSSKPFCLHCPLFVRCKHICRRMSLMSDALAANNTRRGKQWDMKADNSTQGSIISNLFEDSMEYWSCNPWPQSQGSLIHYYSTSTVQIPLRSLYCQIKLTCSRL